MVETTITAALDAASLVCVVSNRTSVGPLSVLKEELMSPNRIVAFLTPLVFAPLAGVISTWAAENLPGVQISQSAMEEIFVAGALIALAPALQWLHGWQKFEARKEDALAAAAVSLTPPSVEATPMLEPEPSEDEFALEDLDELDELDDFDEYEDTSVDEPVTVRS
jgi:hypothetical protein